MPFCSGCAGVLRSPVHARQAPRGAACSSGRATTPWPARSADASEQVQTSECTLKLWSESRSSCATHLPHVPEIRSPTCALAWPRFLLVLFVTFSSGTCRDWLVLGTRAAPDNGWAAQGARRAEKRSRRPYRTRTPAAAGAQRVNVHRSSEELLIARLASPSEVDRSRSSQSGPPPRDDPPESESRGEEGGERARCRQRV